MEEMRLTWLFGRKVPAASHPLICRACGGSGFMAGEPIVYAARAYDTVATCTHSWWLDDPTVDEAAYDTATPLPPSAGRRIAADAYALECVEQGRIPNWDYFDRIFDQIAHDPRTDPS